MACRFVCTAVVSFLMIAGSAWAQETRGTITGTVMDPQGAVIPGATVVVSNTETNVTSRTSTNQTGYFEVNLLNPGMYAVTVEATGFKKSIRGGVELNVAGRMTLEFALQVGQLSETIEVTESVPLLDTASASGGRVIDNRQINELPFTYLNPFVLTALATGMQWTGIPEQRRPFDNTGISAFNTAGNVGQNEYMMDGAPVTGVNRRVGFAPPSDAVGEFKLETTPFDASYGHTSGAVVNVMTKAGTNTYHGSFYEQHYQARWNATPHFQRLAFEDNVRKGLAKPGDPRQPSGRSNIFGATFGGPVRIPKVYNGKDRLFFFFSYNGIYQMQLDRVGSGNNYSVPKMAWRTGDFSDLLAIDATKYTIYDPRSARQQGTSVVRMPFPGNQGIPVLNPIYKFYEHLYPKPMDIPGLVSPEGLNNYVVTSGSDENFNSLINRFDYNIASRHRVFGRWFFNHRNAGGDHWSNAAAPEITIPYVQRYNKGGGGDWVWTIGSTTTMDMGVSLVRYSEGTRSVSWTNYKPSDVGLPTYMDVKAGSYNSIPGVNFVQTPNYGGDYPTVGTIGTTAELRFQFNTIRGSHSLKYGWNERRYSFANNAPGSIDGNFTFNNTYMKATDSTTTASNQGLEWAAFMMGAASSVYVDTNDSMYLSNRYRALYMQDDWRLRRRLHLNLGLRYERETGMRERYSRGIAGQFLYDVRLPFSEAAEAAYAKSPLAELPAAQFKVQGGVQYLSPNNPNFTDGTHHLLPRIGVVYELTQKTVLRAGYGWYYDTFNPNNTPRPLQNGFSQSTSTSISSDNGLSFCCSVGVAGNIAAGRTIMNDPFPVRADGTRFDSPYRDSLGASVLAGGSYTMVPQHFQPAWQQRWSLGIQRQLTRDMVLKASYNGAYAKSFVNQTVNYLPQQYWATGVTRNQAVDDDMNRNVANPFYINNLASLKDTSPVLYDYLSKQSFFRSATVRKNQLLRSFPEMSSVAGLRPGVGIGDAMGGNRYRDLQMELEKRFSHGLYTSVLYTWAHADVQDFYANQFDSAPSWRTNNNVRPQRFVWSAIYELPFGKGRKWATHGFQRAVGGGWQLSWIYQYQSGPATSWGNYFYYGDINNIGTLFNHDAAHGQDIHQWFDPKIVYTGTGAVPANFQGFEGRSAQQPGSFQVRMFPTLLTQMRADGLRFWDTKVLRRFSVAERAKLVFSVDLLNVTNHTNFAAPNTNPTNLNFGRVTSQNGLGRVIQFNLRITF